ncbi:hypothetical protein [Chryseobacterium sp. JV558]|uniref:hypothetical protein n=1 Tax=Chryseobacterium sp. JV558 TaxID=2663236 RepID=UPI00299DFC24|nr:hypothetical protein [Chryseobacterium sp. JV558]MDW9379479.1 hypothetical protein [Chryseobacterium sp. JV558]
MKEIKRLLFFIFLLIFIGFNAQKSKMDIQSKVSDWRNDPFGYAEKIIPKKINDELIPITLKKAYITKVDQEEVVLAICAVEKNNKETSSLTYFFISPQTNQMISQFQSVLTVKGCNLSISAFVIKDINGDKKDDFIFLELYDDKCKGDYWISSNFHQIKPVTTKNELDDYLKLRNDIRINRKVKTTETESLQKQLEAVVTDLFH